jgi:hypothetical protein
MAKVSEGSMFRVTEVKQPAPAHFFLCVFTIAIICSLQFYEICSKTNHRAKNNMNYNDSFFKEYSCNIVANE